MSYNVYVGPYAKIPHQKSKVKSKDKHICINKDCGEYMNNLKKGNFCPSCGSKLEIKSSEIECVLRIEEILNELGIQYSESQDVFADIS